MIPSSRHSRRSQTNDPGETFELTSRAFGNLPTTEEDLDEYLDPDSDASLLERHLVHEIDDESFKDTAILKQPHLFRRFLTFMSHTPLISRFSGVQSYGALPTQDQGSSNDLPKGASSDVGTEDNIKGKLPLLRPSDSTERLRSGQEANEDTARNRFGSRSKNAGPVENAPHDDNIVDIEDGTSSWSDENPPDNSKYPQVRASVSAIDNISASISTPRMWILSLLCALIGSGTNLFFSLRYPSVSITPVIALVVVHPLGRAWDRLFKRDDDPTKIFIDGVLVDQPESPARPKPVSKSTRLRRWLAQGTWNEKEHACVYISSNVSFSFAFATDVIVEQAKFYNQDVSVIYQLLLTISTQILGYAFAGLTREFLVRPPSMIWPSTLMSTSMFTTMHKSENKVANGWKITRWKFFLSVFSGAVLWYFLPGLLFPALSYFSVITWFAPNSVVLANLFGTHSGLGLLPVTFDWAQVAYIGSPLLTPWWAAANVITGLIVVMWIVAPVMYYKNVLFSAFMPILSSSVFDDTGKAYDVSRILTPDYLFDREKYEAYSKVYLPIIYLLSYGVQFASLTALVTHTVCWYGRDIWQVSKQSLAKSTDEKTIQEGSVNAGARNRRYRPLNASSRVDSPGTEEGLDASLCGQDVHTRLMRRYEDAPMTWYLATFVVMLAVGIFLVEYYPIYLPWYGLIFALALTAILFIPVGIVMAITNQHSSLYLICQLICGTVFPGKPVANMVFTTYCYISSAQGVKFSSDLKLGHYMKIPPKLLFKVQMIATLVSSFTQIGVLNWMFSHMPSLCNEDAINGFTCPLARVHFNGSILWGVVGPGRFFGRGALYRPLIYFFPIGLIAPILVWLIGRKRTTTSIWRMINLPVLFGALSWLPAATGLNFSVWAVVCFLFNSVLRRRKPDWWSKYTMTLSAALDSGLAFGVVIIFFGVIYPGWSEGFSWWGTEVYKKGCDWRACSFKTLKPGEHFNT